MAAQKHFINERLLMLKQEFWAAACLSEASSAAQQKTRGGYRGCARTHPLKKVYLKRVAFTRFRVES